MVDELESYHSVNENNFTKVIARIEEFGIKTNIKIEGLKFQINLLIKTLKQKTNVNFVLFSTLNPLRKRSLHLTVIIVTQALISSAVSSISVSIKPITTT